MEHASIAGRRRIPVAKTLGPTQPGAIKLAQRYGDALLCVRYRRSADGRERLTTVELVVDRVTLSDAPTRPDGRRKRDDDIVGVRVRYEEADLRSQVRDAGATWDEERHADATQGSVALALPLLAS